MAARTSSTISATAGSLPIPALRVAVRGWVGFVEAASLDWLEHGGLDRRELRDMLIAALGGAVNAAGGDPRALRPVALERAPSP